jgi:hypothetical protein
MRRICKWDAKASHADRDPVRSRYFSPDLHLAEIEPIDSRRRPKFRPQIARLRSTPEDERNSAQVLENNHRWSRPLDRLQRPLRLSLFAALGRRARPLQMPRELGGPVAQVLFRPGRPAFACTSGQIRFRNTWTALSAASAHGLRTIDQTHASCHFTIRLAE